MTSKKPPSEPPALNPKHLIAALQELAAIDVEFEGAKELHARHLVRTKTNIAPFGAKSSVDLTLEDLMERAALEARIQSAAHCHQKASLAKWLLSNHATALELHAKAGEEAA